MRAVRFFAFSFFILHSAFALATPVEVNWGASETLPAKVARPFGGFLEDGSFLVAGGSDFVDGTKVYRADVQLRAADGSWTKRGELPQPLAEGVSCETSEGLFCAGGTDGKTVSAKAFLLNSPAEGCGVTELPNLPEPVQMGAAACDGKFVYVVTSSKIYRLELSARSSQSDTQTRKQWTPVAELPGVARSQPVAVVQNGDQKEKLLVVYGGFDVVTKAPLRDGYGLVLSTGSWKKLADLPEDTTTIGAAFLASGHQHVLLIGGFGYEGWIARAQNGSTETDPAKLGWQRKILAYNCVTDAWCDYGALAEGDEPRCGAAAGLKKGKTPEQYELILAGGERCPRLAL